MEPKKIITLVIIIVVSLTLILMQVNSHKKGSVNFVEKNTAGIFSPVQSFFSDMGRRISGTWRSFTKISQLEEENRKLTDEINNLKEERQLYLRTREENKKLKKLLNITEKETGKIVAAEVIARNPDNWFKSITINKGYENGVHKNMVAFTSEGLVGRVMSSSKYKARIRLVLNEKSAVPAQLVRSGEMGVVYGEGKGTCIIKYINSDADLKVGDLIMTSRMSRIYPQGKIIGKVTKVYGRDEIHYKAAQIKPTVNFGNLEYVLLIGREK